MRAMKARENNFGFIGSFLDLNTISAKRQISASRAAKQNYIRTAKRTNKELEYRKLCLHDQKKREIDAPQEKQT
jgi:hypothetical protein